MLGRRDSGKEWLLPSGEAPIGGARGGKASPVRYAPGPVLPPGMKFPSLPALAAGVRETESNQELSGAESVAQRQQPA